MRLSHAALLAAPMLAAAAGNAAADKLDYIENIFGATNVNAVAGHGRLTAGFAADGDLTVLSWPGPGFADQIHYLSSNDLAARSLPHLGAPAGMGSYLGLLVGEGAARHVVWLRDLAHTQRYSKPDAPVPITSYQSSELGLTVTVTDIVSPDVDVLTRAVHVSRDRAGAATVAALVVYENLSPSLSRVPQVPIGDWALDAFNDFIAVWDDEAIDTGSLGRDGFPPAKNASGPAVATAPLASGAILHFHPGDRGVLGSFLGLVGLASDVDYGDAEALMKSARPADADVSALVQGIDSRYEPGVAALVTTEPAPTSHQVGSDATPTCAFVGTLLDNLAALPQRVPDLTLPFSTDVADFLRCDEPLPARRASHGWLWKPEDALADLADGALSGSPLAAAETNGALLAPLVFSGDSADAAVVFAFGATRAAARAALAQARTQTPAARQAAAEAAAHAALAGARLPDAALGPRVAAVALRALVNLYVARDAGSGAFLAAVTRQAPYMLDWPRDGAFLSLTADLAGRPDWVTQRATWYTTLIRTQATRGIPLLQPDVPIDPDTGNTSFPAGAWEMNYYVDHEIGGTIRFEIDNSALHVWSLAAHAAVLTGAERKAFVLAVWPTAKQACDLLLRWKDAEGLPAPANEDDDASLTSTLHGAVAVHAGLVAGARLAHAAGDDKAGRAYRARAAELQTAIVARYYDPQNGLFRASRDAPGGHRDAIGGWATSWLVWPGRVLGPDDPRLEAQLASDLASIITLLSDGTGGTYMAKNILSAALYGSPTGARAQARQALALLADVATQDTDAFGEVYLKVGGQWSNRTATPHVWEGALFYLSAMALTDPALFNRDETELPLPAEAEAEGCALASGRPSPAGGAFLLVLIVLVRMNGKGRRVNQLV